MEKSSAREESLTSQIVPTSALHGAHFMWLHRCQTGLSFRKPSPTVHGFGNTWVRVRSSPHSSNVLRPSKIPVKGSPGCLSRKSKLPAGKDGRGHSSSFRNQSGARTPTRNRVLVEMPYEIVQGLFRDPLERSCMQDAE